MICTHVLNKKNYSMIKTTELMELLNNVKSCSYIYMICFVAGLKYFKRAFMQYIFRQVRLI